MNWNPRGHIPPGIYDTPHFDFHFYMISETDRNKITAVGDDLVITEKPPRQEHVPKGYVLAPGGSEPRMGAHWINPESSEFHGQPFTKTFIYGFYDGKMAFIDAKKVLLVMVGSICS
ncbi:MAG: hypothetical protein HYX78_00490 [Armatimonadetes bacterium]|nr:hypothetical protein [Armatimonadota bacterium]